MKSKRRVLVKVKCAFCNKSKYLIRCLARRYKTCSRKCQAEYFIVQYQKKRAEQKLEEDKLDAAILEVLGSTDPRKIAIYLGYTMTFIKSKNLMKEFTTFFRRIEDLKISMEVQELP